MVERLKLIFDYYNLTSSSFAEKIDVPRSSISHLLSGRNKPSLDFILKVDKAFEDISLDWLIYGKGSFPKNNDNATSPSLFTQPTKKETQNETHESKPTRKDHKVRADDLKTIVKVILLYNDGTFDEFKK